MSDGGKKIPLIHFESLSVRIGAPVSPGTKLGYSGKTGGDTYSGRVNSEHAHLEAHRNAKYAYNKDEAVNPADAGYFPRVNVSNNVSVARSTALDPAGNTCWKVVVTVLRADNDFDFNSITLTGDLATRTVNWNTRAGLNANNDIPFYDGVYTVPQTFDETSAAYVVWFFFDKAIVGSTFVTGAVFDTSDVQLAPIT
jgi:hypothetical protein